MGKRHWKTSLHSEWDDVWLAFKTNATLKKNDANQGAIFFASAEQSQQH